MRKGTAWHLALHVLWTKAVGTEGYNKSEWIELETTIIEALERERRSFPSVQRRQGLQGGPR